MCACLERELNVMSSPSIFYAESALSHLDKVQNSLLRSKLVLPDVSTATSK
jgi:hypothetical protein